MNDKDIIKKILEGDIEFFELLVEKNAKYLIDFISVLTNFNETIVHDICQETWIKIYKNIKKFNFTYSFKTWLCSIATNEVKNYYRKHNRHYQNTITLNDDMFTEIKLKQNLIDEELMKKELLDKLLNIIEKLKPKYKIIIKLRYFENLNFETIAKILNESIRNVKYKNAKAKEIIKEKLKKSGYNTII